MVDKNEYYDTKFTITVKKLSQYNDMINQTNKLSQIETNWQTFRQMEKQKDILTNSCTCRITMDTRKQRGKQKMKNIFCSY